MPKKRLVAKRVKIRDIVKGKYFKQEGFEPNYVITDYGLKVSRISIVATIVDIYTNDDRTYGAITFDDGTEIIRAKYFQDLICRKPGYSHMWKAMAIAYLRILSHIRGTFV